MENTVPPGPVSFSTSVPLDRTRPASHCFLAATGALFHLVQVVIAEGTYTSLLKNVDAKVFIARNRVDTLAHRQKRNRGNEVGDPFIENVLKIEHKIIAGHKQLANFIITKDYDVIVVE